MYKQYELPYGFDELEPWIDAATVETHHDKHHATYTANLNTLAQKAGVDDMDIDVLLASASLDKLEGGAVRTGIRNNGGCFYTHTL